MKRLQLTILEAGNCVPSESGATSIQDWFDRYGGDGSLVDENPRRRIAAQLILEAMSKSGSGWVTNGNPADLRYWLELDPSIRAVYISPSARFSLADWLTEPCEFPSDLSSYLDGVMRSKLSLTGTWSFAAEQVVAVDDSDDWWSSGLLDFMGIGEQNRDVLRVHFPGELEKLVADRLLKGGLDPLLQALTGGEGGEANDRVRILAQYVELWKRHAKSELPFAAGATRGEDRSDVSALRSRIRQISLLHSASQNSLAKLESIGKSEWKVSPCIDTTTVSARIDFCSNGRHRWVCTGVRSQGVEIPGLLVETIEVSGRMGILAFQSTGGLVRLLRSLREHLAWRQVVAPRNLAISWDLIPDADVANMPIDALSREDALLLQSIFRAIAVQAGSNACNCTLSAVESGEVMRVLDTKVEKATFRSVSLISACRHDEYEHIWLRLYDFCAWAVIWPVIDLRLASSHPANEEFGSMPKVEFPWNGSGFIENDLAKSYFDEFGYKYELRFAKPSEMDFDGWMSLGTETRAMVKALIDALPHALQRLPATDERALQRPISHWLEVVNTIQASMRRHLETSPVVKFAANSEQPTRGIRRALRKLSLR
ncbi:MAG: hypothetical protein F2840_09085 [Actinobacteria bacterium]|nr:hypothetical protein [Actinomycetota bacterium]